MTYTEDRAAFEHDIFRPPHLARMLEHAARYVGKLAPGDKDLLLSVAMDQFWETRNGIRKTADILRLWDTALRGAARTRDRWCEWSNLDSAWHWVSGKYLGRN